MASSHHFKCVGKLCVWKHFTDLVQYDYVDTHPTGLLLLLLESWNISIQRWGEIHSNYILKNKIYRMKTGPHYWNNFRPFIWLEAIGNIFSFAYPRTFIWLTLTLPSRFGSLIFPASVPSPSYPDWASWPFGFLSILCMSLFLSHINCGKSC